VQSLFANRTSSKYGEFEQALVQYITIVAPFICSLWSLEAAHANASDVYIFWLAIQATLTDLFSKNTVVTGIQNSLANGVTAIVNKHYKEFFAHEVYFVAFALDPRKPLLPFSRFIIITHILANLSKQGYPNAEFFKKPTPNPAVTTITIPALHQCIGH
jgi:hypothetical protein